MADSAPFHWSSIEGSANTAGIRPLIMRPEPIVQGSPNTSASAAQCVASGHLKQALKPLQPRRSVQSGEILWALKCCRVPDEHEMPKPAPQLPGRDVLRFRQFEVEGIVEAVMGLAADDHDDWPRL